MVSEYQSKFHLRRLTVFWMYLSIQMQCCFTVSIHFHLFIFFILSFSCFIIVALIALMSFCVLSISTSLMLGHILLALLFIRRCLVQRQFTHIFYSTFYAVFMCNCFLWMMQCYFIVLTMDGNLFWEVFLLYFSNRFIIVLMIDFT